jgi:hypothetical protein
MKKSGALPRTPQGARPLTHLGVQGDYPPARRRLASIGTADGKEAGRRPTPRKGLTP